MFLSLLRGGSKMCIMCKILTQKLAKAKGTFSTIIFGVFKQEVALGICFSDQYAIIPDAVSCITLKSKEYIVRHGSSNG